LNTVLTTITSITKDQGPPSNRYGERLAEIGETLSIGTVGDSYDSTLIETIDGYYRTELVRGPAWLGPETTAEDLELATLSWVYW
jgi:putative transposase